MNKGLSLAAITGLMALSMVSGVEVLRVEDEPSVVSQFEILGSRRPR